MPQNPLGTYVAKKTVDGEVTFVPLVTNPDTGALIVESTGAVDPSDDPANLNVDASGNLRTSGGVSFATNIGAAVAVKATPGRLRRIIILAPGSGSGVFSVNNSATTGTAAAANLIWTRAFGDVKAGDIYEVDVPCSVGITVSAVPGAGTPLLALVYD